MLELPVKANTSVWYPFTQMKTAPEHLKVVSAKGVKLKLEDGREIIDGVSSWWVNLHGHSRPEIAQAIYEQALKLEHVIFSNCTHEPAEKLAEQLIALLPSSLTKVFYSDNGSTSVEIAIKQCYQYWHNQGQKRQKFICFQGGHHGETLGALSLAGNSVFNLAFRDLLFEVHSIPYPFIEEGHDVQAKEEAVFDILEKLFDQCPNQIAGIIIEPLIQGAGGMRLCRSQFLQKLSCLAKEAGTLLIYDEIMTGFGRTGELFACTKAETIPDIICLSKGLTGGFLPFAVTISTQAIYNAFYSDDALKTFFHGHSYTGNPLGCAAALASLELLQKEPFYKTLEQQHRQLADKYLKESEKIANLRFCGTIMAFDLKVEQAGYLNPQGRQIREACLQQGLLIRPLGNVIYFMPPYCITDVELQEAYQALAYACH